MVQSDSFTASAIATVVVAVITSNTALAAIPGNVFVPASASRLPKDSAINVTQLVTLTKGDLGERVAMLPAYLLTETDAGLRRVLAR